MSSNPFFYNGTAPARPLPAPTTPVPAPPGSDHDNGHAAAEMIDQVYSYWPGTTPAPQPCPEAVFSLTLKGKLDGQEALLTARGQTAEEFRRNLQSGSVHMTQDTCGKQVLPSRF
jgi:hypothetical protein